MAYYVKVIWLFIRYLVLFFAGLFKKFAKTIALWFLILYFLKDVVAGLYMFYLTHEIYINVFIYPGECLFAFDNKNIVVLEDNTNFILDDQYKTFYYSLYANGNEEIISQKNFIQAESDYILDEKRLLEMGRFRDNTTRKIYCLQFLYDVCGFSQPIGFEVRIIEINKDRLNDI